MEYIITDKKVAENYGFNPQTHLVVGTKICLNEKEVLGTQTLKGTLKTRVKTLGGKIYSRDEALEIMKTKNS